MRDYRRRKFKKREMYIVSWVEKKNESERSQTNMQQKNMSSNPKPVLLTKNIVNLTIIIE